LLERERWPGVAWVGSVGVGVCATAVEYSEEPALVLMLGSLPAASFEVFSGVRKLQDIDAWTALVHADPTTPELGELIDELSDRTGSGYLFGGLAAAQGQAVHVADGVWGGLSGVGFARGGAGFARHPGQPAFGPTHHHRSERNMVTTLTVSLRWPVCCPTWGWPQWIRASCCACVHAGGLTNPARPPGATGAVWRRHARAASIGLDPSRQAVAVAGAHRHEAGVLRT
jgi:hypothetical protein